jgi:hypothetical protein
MQPRKFRTCATFEYLNLFTTDLKPRWGSFTDLTNRLFCQSTQIRHFFHCLYQHYSFLKLIIGDKRAVLHLGFVGVNGVNGVVKDLRNGFVLVYPEADEGEDAQLRIQQVVGIKVHPVLLL